MRSVKLGHQRLHDVFFGQSRQQLAQIRDRRPHAGDAVGLDVFLPTGRGTAPGGQSTVLASCSLSTTNMTSTRHAPRARSGTGAAAAGLR